MEPTKVNSTGINLAPETSALVVLSGFFFSCQSLLLCWGESKFQVLHLLLATTLDLWLSCLQAEMLLFFLLECQNSNLELKLQSLPLFRQEKTFMANQGGKLTGSLLVRWDSRIRSGEDTHIQTILQKGRVFREQTKFYLRHLS